MAWVAPHASGQAAAVLVRLDHDDLLATLHDPAEDRREAHRATAENEQGGTSVGGH